MLKASKVGFSKTFIPALFSAAVLALTFGTPARAGLLTNGGFETGDFTGWTSAGNNGFDGVTCPGPSPSVAEGSCSGFFGAVGSTSTLSQSFATTNGAQYLVSFAFQDGGDNPSTFSAVFDGITLVDLTNPNTLGFHTYSFTETANSTLSTLTFTFRDDPGFEFLDAVSVQAPEPLTLSVFGAGLAGAVAMRRRRKVDKAA